jgi:primosomal protein N' (replication factor Y) (superfamily II helicase)
LYTHFADVIIPLALPRNYTYGIPEELKDKISIGQRVEVPLGKQKIYAGIVKNIHANQPVGYEVKPILSLIDDTPIVTTSQLRFWQWIAEYYMCSEGEVMNAALPAGFKLESETTIHLHPDFKDDFSKLDDKEYLVAEALTLKKKLLLKEVQQILHRKTVRHVLRSLLDKNVITIEEGLSERYKPRMETFVRLTAEYNNDFRLKELLDELVKAPKQLNVMMTFLHFKNISPNISKTDLLKKSGTTNATLAGLVKKNILELYKKDISRLEENINTSSEFHSLNTAQAEALKNIQSEFLQHDTVLLNGITSSGKTLVYIELIKQAIAQGKQTLYLLPEIALTGQMISRLRKVFGNRIGIYHSGFNSSERVEVWNRLSQGDYDIVLGARSAIFLPFKKLGLIVVDEEHDNSFKQFDPAPRYHARDSAIYLAALHKAKVLLGSATPSLESNFNAQQKKYGSVLLRERFGNMQLPEIILVNIKELKRRKEMKSIFSPFLIDELTKILQRNEQAILFQNRKGYAPTMECENCGWSPMCPNCDVHLTYYKFKNDLRCHYCGYHTPSPTKCPACNGTKLKISGFGTEKVEDEFKLFFPVIKIVRMDYDSVKTKFSHNKIISDFEKKNYQVLAGTQMVTKGLDFDDVTLVSVLNADQLMSFPDFRSLERAYQLMAQVSGRAGRKNRQGEVIIQTSQPGHPLFQFVLEHSYTGFYNYELPQRQKFFYPPYSRLIRITLKHKDQKLLDDASHHFATLLKRQLHNRVMGPAEPMIARIKNYYLADILLKMEKQSKELATAKQYITFCKDELSLHKTYKTVYVEVDVDPY